MNIFITGANGYLAKNLVKEIVDTTNHNLILLVRENSNVDDLIKFVNIDNIVFYDGTLESLKGLQKYKIDLIFHLANYYPDAERPAIKEEIISSNFTLIANVLNSLGRDIFIPYKSSGQYPLNFRIINVTSHVVFDDKDQSTYKVTKELAFKYLSSQNCKSYVLHDTYGINDPRPKLINYLIDYSKTGDNLVMKNTKDSEINLVYYKDVISAFMLAIDNMYDDDNKYYHICCDTLTLDEVIDIFNQVSKKKVVVEWPEDSSLNKNCLTGTTPQGWKPMYDFKKGLTEILKL